MSENPLAVALATVTDASVAVDDWIADCGDDTETLAEVYATIDDTIHVMLLVRDIVKAAILKRSKWDPEGQRWTLGDKEFPYLLPGGGYMIRRGGKQATRYDQDQLVGQLANGITARLVDADVAARVLTSDGTIVPLQNVVDEVARWMAKAAGATAPSFTSWRTGVSKELGVDLKEFVDDSRKTEVTLQVDGRRAG